MIFMELELSKIETEKKEKRLQMGFAATAQLFHEFQHRSIFKSIIYSHKEKKKKQNKH